MLQRMSLTEVKDILKTWREDNSRKSDEIIEHWEDTIREEIDDLGEEKWMILEQVCVAGFDTYRPDVVEDTLYLLIQQFTPSSLRVKRLIAMRYEMREEWGEALEVLDQILEEDEANSSARKRKIAIYKAQGDTSKAASELTKYLRVFQSDQEAWQELCDIYIQEQEYNKACFCCEELLLHNPHNHLYHQRLGEIRYTMGGTDNLENAKQYFSQAVKMAPSNMRALYGLLLTCTQLATNPKCHKKKDYAKIVFWASKQISARYNNAGLTDKQSKLPVIEGLMSQLDVSGK
eukprot:TRINITY_DN6687_c0_g1_i11.p1 TRINITY_DN6687_c0_g1~~TRINITY_DN6687_c0_g1_i11.p1  ORF type:complete len:290 (-),score=48.88 TRINITY_DN6687_c0_g1_i11:379-1248(-)